MSILDDRISQYLSVPEYSADRGCIIQYETNSEDVRRMFEEHGEIKTFFDLIANRGMVFVTYVSRKSI